MSKIIKQIQDAQNFLKTKSNADYTIGIVLGTGLGRLVESIDTTLEINYGDIPHFPLATAESHAGKVILGTLSGKKVFVMQGRFHIYEGYSMDQIVFPIRLMKFLGSTHLVISNAAGGINPLFSLGTIMAITDHINLLGTNPLIGLNDDRIGPRYPDMSEPYSNELLEITKSVAIENKIPLSLGVYAAMTGPCLETRAEYRMLKILGADAIGMSTIPEVIAAVHAGIKVLGFSVITDTCLPDALEPVDIQKIINTANNTEPTLVKLIKEVVKKI